MFRRRLTMQGQMLGRVAAEVLLAARVSEDQIAETADSPDLYAKLRARIANASELRISRSRMRDGRIFTSWRFVRSPLAIAVSVLLLIALALILWLPKASNERAVLAPQSPAPFETGAIEPTPPSKDEPVRVAETTPPQTKRTSYWRPKSNYQRHEVATDFLPLTFVADSAAQESGHVVRVSVPRSALIAFGVPMNVERAGEFIMADVMIGDDGLARAIRFVQ